MSNPLHATGDHAGAIKTLGNAISIYEPILELAPKDNALRMLLAEANYKKARAALYLNDWRAAEKGYLRTIYYLRAPELGAPIEGKAAKWEQEVSELALAALGRLTRDENPEADPSSECLALLMVARADAMTSTTDQLSRETRNIVSNINPQIAAETFADLFTYLKSLSTISSTVRVYRSQFEARINALRAENLAADEETPEQQAELIRQSIDVLKQLARFLPQAKTELIFNEPDLIWLRATDEFRQSGIDSLPK